MSYIEEYGEPAYYWECGDEELTITLMPLEDFLEMPYYDSPESLFLWRDGEWRVRSSHIEGCDDRTWYSLDSIPEVVKTIDKNKGRQRERDDEDLQPGNAMFHCEDCNKRTEHTQTFMLPTGFHVWECCICPS